MGRPPRALAVLKSEPAAESQPAREEVIEKTLEAAEPKATVLDRLKDAEAHILKLLPLLDRYVAQEGIIEDLRREQTTDRRELTRLRLLVGIPEAGTQPALPPAREDETGEGGE